MLENCSCFKIIERYKIARKVPGTLRLWSLQPLEIWQQLQRWERIFDLELLVANGWAANSLQACFEELNLKDVVAVEILDIR